MQLNQLFPTPVAFFDLPREFTRRELKFIKGQPTRPNMGNTSSENNYIMEKPELAELKEFCDASVNHYFREVYSPDTSIKLRITQSWANYTEGGQFHHRHAHPNSLISGVMYIQSDPTKDRIYFYKTGYQQLKVKVKDWNSFNSESWWFESKPAQLILFPSSLEHMVQNTEAGAMTRISMSFNTFPVGVMGDYMELTELLL